MKHLWRRLTACAAAGALLAMAAAPARAEDWVHAESDHFTVYSTAGEGPTRSYVHKLEQFRTLTNMLLGVSGDGPQVKFVIYLILQDQMTKVRPYFSPRVGGVYLNCDEGTTAYSGYTPNEVFDGEDSGLITLLHEYSHYIMFQHARTAYPAWYVEGFAEYLSTADTQKGFITVGDSSKMRAYTLTEDRWIDFARVLNPSFGFAGAKGNDPWEIESFYAQSWLLTHYMLSDSARTKALNAYIARLAQGEDPVSAWETATGIKVADLKTILRRYYDHMFYLRVPVPDYDDKRIALSQVPAAEQSYLLDASLLSTCPTADQGKAILGRLLALKETDRSPHLRLALARAQLLYGDPGETIKDMDALSAADPANAEALYLLGRGLLKIAATASAADRKDLMETARGAFLASYSVNKLNAPNLYYLAQSFSGEPGFPDKSALNAANGAHILAPSVPGYAVFAAFANLSNGQRDAAAALLTPFVGDPHNREAAERFKAAIDAIHAGKTTAEVMTILNGAATKAH
ncbi:MAG: DUF1570 domain-containing protein [Asticcacaulis sp.]